MLRRLAEIIWRRLAGESVHGELAKLTIYEMTAILFVHFKGTTIKSGEKKAVVIDKLAKLMQEQPALLLEAHTFPG